MFDSGSMEIAVPSTEVVPAGEEEVAAFEDFFSAYSKKDLADLAAQYPQKKSYALDLAVLSKFDSELADKLLEQPDAFVRAAEEAVRRMGFATPTGVKFTPHVRVFNLPETSDVAVQDLGAEHIDRMIRVEGVVSWIAEIKPRVKTAVWECVHCETVMKTYPEKSMILPPELCRCGRRNFRLLEAKSEFVNVQRAQVQDPVEKLRGNMPTTHVELWMEDDLVNTMAPGERVVVTGILRLRPIKEGRTKSSVYAKFLDVMHLHKVEREFEELEVTKEEEKELLELAKNPHLTELVVKSIAPSIYGHNELKEAIALQLFGGAPGKVLPDEEKIRSDIHILLVGDPGTAKTSILSYVSQLAPKCVFVSGGGASGVGLCVAPDSLVIVNDEGIIPIRDVVERNLTEPVEEKPNAFSSPKTLRIMSIDENLRTCFKESVKVWRIKTPEKLVKITVRRGKTVTITPATSLLTLKQGELVWTKAADISKGVFVATSRKIPGLNAAMPPVVSLLDNPNIFVFENKEDIQNVVRALVKKYGSLTEAARKHGLPREQLYVWHSNSKRRQSIPLRLLKKLAEDAGIEVKVERVSVRDGKHVKLPQEIDSCLLYLAGLIAADGGVCIGRRGDTASVRLHSSDPSILASARKILRELFEIESNLENDGRRVSNLRCHSVVLAELLNRLGIPSGEKYHLIDMPDFLFASRLARHFVRGLFDCGGYIALNKKASDSIRFSTTSEILARKLQLWFEQVGVVAKLRARNVAGRKSFIRGKLVESKRPQYYVEIVGKENFEAFQREVGFTHPAKNRKLREALSKLSKNKGNPNLDLVPEVALLLRAVKEKFSLPEKVLPLSYARGERSPSRSSVNKILAAIPADSSEAKRLRMLSSPDIYWDKIEKIELLENAATTSAAGAAANMPWVYDFSMSLKAFLANGIVVHNTAAAERDESGEGWILKAGAMVLASGGLAIVDEFDKMREEDRGAIHDAMERQMISIAKAGIVTQFQAKTAVLAAANPKLGRFDPNTPVAQQFDISPALLSRFDLIFTIRDVLDETQDRRMAEHILKGHRFAGERRKAVEEKDFDIMPAIPMDLLRKYIAYARRNIFPVLTDEASEKIKEFFVELRRLGMQQNTFPITARQIEGIIRLAEASAKMRLSNKVEAQDAERAIALVNHVLRDVFVDRETGRIDSDVIFIGQSKSRLDKIRTLLGVISSLERETDLVSVEDVVSAASRYGLDEPYARRLIDELKRQGDLYEPKVGFVKSSRVKAW